MDLFRPYVREWINASFDEPSPPQRYAWPLIAEGKNTLVFSPTGSGKTLSAFLWSINELFALGEAGDLDDTVYVLYVSPLRALDNDVQRNLVLPLEGIRQTASKMGVELPEVRSVVRTGDTRTGERAKMARKPPHILITTPESLYIILTTQKFRTALKSIRYVIVDEIHSISDNKRGVQLSLSLERLVEWVGRDVVRIGLSATQSPIEDVARFLVGYHGSGEERDCHIVDIGARKGLDVGVISPVPDLLGAQFDDIWDGTYAKMLELIRAHETTLVFTNSRYRTEKITLKLQEGAESDLRIGSHHGSMAREVRFDMEQKLKNAELNALVATSSLELGIDVGSIDLVCQTESPKSVSRGIQRVGRAGHLLSKTSKGRLIVVDRDDLVEGAALARGIMASAIEQSRIPRNCLDILAQQIVAACAADEWDVKALYEMCRRSYCYRELRQDDFMRVIELLAGEYAYLGQQRVYPKVHWNKIAGTLAGTRGSRFITFRCGGAIPDVADYAVHHQAHKTRIGQLDEGFVEQLHAGDVFVLGNTTWQVLSIEKNRVNVRDVYGVPPTIPYWGGDRPSRTYGLGVLVGQFKEEMNRRLPGKADEILSWLRSEYYLDEDGARAILEYFQEQYALMGRIPTHRHLVVEAFTSQLGQQQIVIHSPFGVWFNDAWSLALAEAVRRKYGFRPVTATVDDGTLVAAREGKTIDADSLLGLVTTRNLGRLMDAAIWGSPVFHSRFRHNAVRALMVLREYKGRRTPVWAQNYRSARILEETGDDRKFPVVKETLRECQEEALDVPNLKRVLDQIESGEISTEVIHTKTPSPFTHTLLLLGQYGDLGQVSTKERQARLMHLHREVLKQLLTEDELKELLHQEEIERFVAKRQHLDPETRARSKNEIVELLSQSGGLVESRDSDLSIFDRVEGDVAWMMNELWQEKRIMQVPVTTAKDDRVRWIATRDYEIFRAAFAKRLRPREIEKRILGLLEEKDRMTASAIEAKLAAVRAERSAAQVREALGRLADAYLVTASGKRGTKTEWSLMKKWLPL